MNRRDFAKGLAALPFIGGSQQFLFAKSQRLAQQKPKAKAASPITGKLHVILEGPFALVMLAAKKPIITVVSPMESHKKHFFELNRMSEVHKKRHSISFLTAAGALVANADFPQISDTLLKPFSWHSNDWNQSDTDNLIDMDLPSPDSIQGLVLPDRTTKVAFESDPNTFIQMPTGLVLEYTINDTQKLIEMMDSMIAPVTPDPDDNIPNLFNFDLEVGLPFLPNGDDPDANGAHAVDFHNNFLLPRFPSIKGDSDKRFAKVVEIFTKVYPLTTTTFECKLGGFVVSVP